MNKKRIGILTAILILALVFTAGCNNEKGNNLYIGVEGEELNLALAGQADNPAHLTLLKHLYKGIFEYDASGQPVPVLAESFNYSEDGKTIFIKTKDGITWSDGQAISPEDILLGLKNNMEADQGKYSYLYNYLDLKNENAISLDEDNHLVLKLKKSFTDFEKILAMPVFYPVLNSEDFLAGPFSGDFVVDKKSKSKISLVPARENQDAKQAGPESITFEFSLSRDKLLKGFQEKDYDIIFPKDPVANLKGQTYSLAGGQILWLNAKNEDLKNLEARQKIQEALGQTDKKTDYLFANQGIRLLFLNDQPSIKEVEKIKSQLEKKLGLEVELVGLELEEYFASLREGNFDLALEEWQGEYMGKNAFYEYFQNPIYNPLNASGLNLPAVNDLQNQINKIADSDQREELFLALDAELKKMIPALIISEGIDKEVYIQRVKKTLVNPVYSYHDYTNTSF